MTSKEALKLAIKCSFFAQDNDELQEIYEAREKLEKDLEVLEILKKYSYSHDNFTLFIALECMNIDELEKVKDWLEK